MMRSGIRGPLNIELVADGVLPVTPFPERITRAVAALTKVVAQIERSQAADEKIRTLQDQRRDASAGVFEAIAKEEELEARGTRP